MKKSLIALTVVGLLAGCGEPSLLRHDDGDDDQEVVARMVVQLQTGATQSPA